MANNYGKRLEYLPADYVCLDLETTGRAPENGGEIIEIGAVKVRNYEICEEFSQTVKPRTSIPGRITELTGITNAEVRLSPHIESVLPEFLEFAGDMLILGQCVTYDLGFITFYKELICGTPFLNSYMDTCFLSRRVFGGRSGHNLAALAGRFGIVNQHSHRALSDVYTTHACYIELLKYIEETNWDTEKLK